MSLNRKIKYPPQSLGTRQISLIPVIPIPSQSPNDQSSKAVNRKRPKNEPDKNESVLCNTYRQEALFTTPIAGFLSTLRSGFNGNESYSQANSPSPAFQKTSVGTPAKRQKICRTDSADKRKSTSTPKPSPQKPINLSASDKKKSTNSPKPSLPKPINLSAKPSETEIVKVKKEDDKLETETALDDKLRIILLSLKYALEKKYSFAFATDTDSEGNFDDIAFQYKEPNGKLVYRLLRVKHETRTTRVIRMNDLLAENDNKFSLQKHFFSYQKATNNRLFEDYKMKDYIICTNINMEDSLKNYFAPISGNDKILTFEQTETERLKLKFDEFPKKNELFSVLKKTSTCNRLAKQLAKCVKYEEVIDLKDDLFKRYHRALRRYVIEPENTQDTKGQNVKAKFNKSFLEGHLSEQAKKFRTAFYEAYKHLSNESIDKVEFWKNMKTVRPKMAHCFKTMIELDDDPKLTECKMLAEEIAKEIRTPKGDIVQLGRRTLVMRENIDKLAGYVFVEKDNMEKDTYCFNSEFFKDDYKLPDDLIKFKNYLIEDLNNKGVPFDKHEYKFKIREFKTCVEAVVHSEAYLPDDNEDEKITETDIREFFEKLVFVINQPHDIKLDKIYAEKISKYYNSSFDADIACSLQKDILNKMKAKQGCFQPHKDGNEFFKMTHNVISNLVAQKVHESTIKYCKSLESFGTPFMDAPPELRSFFNSKQEQILNFISSLDTTLVQASNKNPENKSESSLATTLSAIKVMHALKKIPAYQIENSYIFMHMSSILTIRDHILDVFDSETSNHLLVIECGSEKVNFWKLYQRLCSILERRPNKKIIIITDRNDILAEAFRGFFSENENTFREIKDKSNRA
ncbi:uncharacterized protein LOC135848458 [Planococcus citri]|uniref:uncharacterized protein LOC135848458 n=1 Tax=Planococcus citri TaxID=170843 RepID=UPI0031FA17B2